MQSRINTYWNDSESTIYYIILYYIDVSRLHVHIRCSAWARAHGCYGYRSYGTPKSALSNFLFNFYFVHVILTVEKYVLVLCR